MMPVKVGDYVRISNRDETPADAKSGLFYRFFRNLTGTIERIYEDRTICVNVDIDSLPADIRQRHAEIQDAARNRWINGLPQEQRNRLTEQDKQFRMSYKILVAAVDVSPEKKPSKAPGALPTQKKVDTAKVEGKPVSGTETADVAKTAKPAKEPSRKRLTEKDLTAAEEAFLKSRMSKDGK